MFKKTLLGVTVAAIAVAAWNLSQAAADGKAVYEGKCKTCHAPDGSGMKDGKWLPIAKTMKLDEKQMAKLSIVSADAKKLSDAEFEKAILEGTGKMKPMKDKVTADEAKAITAYSRDLQKQAK
ncbi:MAG: cytochrome c [Pseudomonadota bacterium]